MDPSLNYTIKDILQDFRNRSLITGRYHNEPFLNKPIEFNKILEIYDNNKLKYTYCPSLYNIYYTKTFEKLPKLHYFLLCIRYNILKHKLKLFGGDIRNIYNDLRRTDIYDLDFNIDKTKLETSLKFIRYSNYHTYYHYIQYNFIDNILAILYKYIFNNDDNIKLTNLYTFYIPTIQTPQITYEYSFYYNSTIYKLKIDLIEETSEHKIHEYFNGDHDYDIENYFKDYEENGIYIYMNNNKEIKKSMYRPYEKVNKSVKHYFSKKYNSALIILRLLGSVTLNIKSIIKQIYDFIGDDDIYLWKVCISNMNYELTPSHTICSNKYTIDEYFKSSISCKIALKLYERKKKFELLNYTIANFTCECETCCNMIIYPNENTLAKLKQVQIKVPDSTTTYGPSEIYYHNNTSKEDVPKINKYATLFPINKHNILELTDLKINYYTNNIRLPNKNINNYEDIEYSESDDLLYQRQQKLNNKQININKKKLFKQEETQEFIQNKKIQQTNINKYVSNKKKYNYTIERKYKYTNK
jgi:hypothetical protein